MTKFLEDVKAERSRQVHVEGFDAAHDDQQDVRNLVAAAAAYMYAANFPYTPHSKPPTIWPWDVKWWKPSRDARRNLEKAAALTIAAGEKLDRDRQGRKIAGVPEGWREPHKIMPVPDGWFNILQTPPPKNGTLIELMYFNGVDPTETTHGFWDAERLNPKTARKGVWVDFERSGALFFPSHWRPRK